MLKIGDVNCVLIYLLIVDLDVSAVSGIYGLGRWFTEGHIETAGDESVAPLGFGKKAFIYAKSGRAGRWLILSVKSASSFRDMVRRGPPKGLEESFFGCVVTGEFNSTT